MLATPRTYGFPEETKKVLRVGVVGADGRKWNDWK